MPGDGSISGGVMASTADRGGAAAMALGLTAFGLALGAIAGLSVSAIAQTLLTSVFTFVGGVLLSFAGFTVADRTSEGTTRTRIDTFRTGIGLAGFSLGLVGGVVGGIYLRVLHPGVVTPTCDGKTIPVVSSSSADGGVPPAKSGATEGRTGAIAPTLAPTKPPTAPAWGLQDETIEACAQIRDELAHGSYDRDHSLAAARIRQLHAAQCAGR